MTLNREERRALRKRNKRRDLRAAATDLFNCLKDSRQNEIRDGDFVELNVPQIIGRKEFAGLQEGYRRFVEESRGKIFTAHPYRARADGFSAVMRLDGTEWTFWHGDLIKVEKGV